MMQLLFEINVMVILIKSIAGILSDEFEIGGALNILKYFGDASILMRVTPRNDTKWLFRDISPSIFSDAVSTSKTFCKIDGESEFEVIFCDNLNELYNAYFKNIRIEDLDENWRVFINGWSSRKVYQKFGIPENYQNSKYSFILVRITKYVNKCFLNKSSKILTVNIKNLIRNMTVNSEQSVMTFINNIGTHYISSYAEGDGLYQVFTFDSAVYDTIKHVTVNNPIIREQFRTLLSPSYALHIGKIISISGNKILNDLANRICLENNSLHNYSSLLKLHNNSKLYWKLTQLCYDDALVNVQLQTIDNVIEDTQKKKWFKEVIQNKLKIYEINS